MKQRNLDSDNIKFKNLIHHLQSKYSLIVVDFDVEEIEEAIERDLKELEKPKVHVVINQLTIEDQIKEFEKNK